MLSEEEKKEIDEEIATLPQKRAACLGALKAVQKHRGWVSDEGIRDIAEYLELTPDEVDSLATYFSLIFRHPVGRHVILMCKSVSCWIMGYETIQDYFKKRLGIDFGQTTPDGRFTLLPVVCLGACYRAPAVMIDDDLHGPVTEQTLDRILERYK
ncbi:MAG: NADH-quinone oxidoreductase subunit NuoE [Candidatus Sumerlaeota bacterium]|nr:NADH-quinone oxidoreductase subunit NuoE [Candidatus Sumerlaeota bacterium]